MMKANNRILLNRNGLLPPGNPIMKGVGLGPLLFLMGFREAGGRFDPKIGELWLSSFGPPGVTAKFVGSTIEHP